MQQRLLRRISSVAGDHGAVLASPAAAKKPRNMVSVKQLSGTSSTASKAAMVRGAGSGAVLSARKPAVGGHPIRGRSGLQQTMRVRRWCMSVSDFALRSST